MLKKFLFVCAAAVMLTSCGGSEGQNGDNKELPAEVALKPSTTDVSGGLSACYKVVDRDYKAIKDKYGSSYMLTVELERTDAGFPVEVGEREIWCYGSSGKSDAVLVGFGIEILDADGNILEKGNYTRPYSSEDPVALGKLKAGDKGSMQFSIYNMPEKAAKFRIISGYDEYKGWDSQEAEKGESTGEGDSTGKGGEETTEAAVESSSSNEWDELLDSYEEIVNKYVSYAKKATTGEVDYMELMELSEEMNTYSQKLAAVEGEMTTSQITRLQKIAKKAAAAMM